MLQRALIGRWNLARSRALAGRGGLHFLGTALKLKVHTLLRALRPARRCLPQRFRSR